MIVSSQQQFLRFQLQSELTAVIEIALVTELVNIASDRIVPMPHLPPAVMGVYNWRGEILWVVDLAVLLGARSSTSQHRSLQPTIILTSEVKGEDRQSKTVGFVVEAIAEIAWFDPLPNLGSEDIDPKFSSWASGVLVTATGEQLLKLDGHTIIDRIDFNADI